jgi:hypothetical protein
VLLAAVAAAGPFPRVPSAPAVGRIEPPPPARPTPRYVNIFNRVGRSYEVVPLDEDGRLPERFRQSPICSHKVEPRRSFTCASLCGNCRMGLADQQPIQRLYGGAAEGIGDIVAEAWREIGATTSAQSDTSRSTSRST